MLANTRQSCSVHQLHKLLESSESCAVIDVREYPEYAAGRVPGAKLMPLGELARRSKELDSLKPIYLICRSGRRGAEGQQQLLKMGFNDVYNVEGGTMAWQQAGYPMEQDEKAPWSLERQVRLVAGAIVLIGVLLSVFVAQPFIWLAGFVGTGLIFAAITDSCAMAMLLARLPWNRTTKTPSCSTR